MTLVSHEKLRDYSADSRMLVISALAGVLGAISSVAAWALLELIALFTNIFYFHRWSFTDVDPWQSGIHWYRLNTWWSVLAPVTGGLIVGLVARYLSPRVRGHGMPEAVETIVFGGGRVQPRVAVLKPVATAISIGSGGPFGAEGPVIITGGAIGSVLGQLLPVTESERTVLMVSGAAAGMAATFNAPFSAILLAVEILLFEWRPRSLVPVSVACIMAGAVRHLLLGSNALLGMPTATLPSFHLILLGTLAVGIVAALFSAGLSRALHATEDFFEHLPFHWMWYPAIGGLGIGLGGMVFPQALGVGYSVVGQMLNGDMAWKLLLGVIVVKSAIWIFSLGSNTAGGILAPLLMLGGAMGAAMGHGLPSLGVGGWALVGMTSLLTAAIGCPLTSAMLALELTHNASLILPVLLGSMTAFALSVLVQPRSMLTESLSRRGLHLSRELGVDPLEMILVQAAMHTSVFALPADATRQDAADWLATMQARGPSAWSHWQRLFPLLDAEGKLVAVLTRSQMIAAAQQVDREAPLAQDGLVDPETLSPRDTMRSAAAEMAESKLTHFPVVDDNGKFCGLVTIEDLLKGRSREKLREMDRTRVLRMRWPYRRGAAAADPTPEAAGQVAQDAAAALAEPAQANSPQTGVMQSFGSNVEPNDAVNAVESAEEITSLDGER